MMYDVRLPFQRVKNLDVRVEIFTVNEKQLFDCTYLVSVSALEECSLEPCRDI